MKDCSEAVPFAECLTSGSSWMQITFTLDVDLYRMLRDRAEAERLTVPGFVRESVTDALKGIRNEADWTLTVAE